MANYCSPYKVTVGLTWVRLIYAHSCHICRGCVLSLTEETSALTRIRSENCRLMVVLKMEIDKNIWDEETFPFTCEKYQLYLQRRFKYEVGNCCHVCNTIFLSMD